MNKYRRCFNFILLYNIMHKKFVCSCVCVRTRSDRQTDDKLASWIWRTKKELSYEIIMYSEFQRKCSKSIGECCASEWCTNVNLNKYALYVSVKRDCGWECRRGIERVVFSESIDSASGKISISGTTSNFQMANRKCYAPYRTMP